MQSEKFCGSIGRNILNIGVSYTGSTHGLGPCRQSSILCTPTKILTDSPGDYPGSCADVDRVRFSAPGQRFTCNTSTISSEALDRFLRGKAIVFVRNV